MGADRAAWLHSHRSREWGWADVPLAQVPASSAWVGAGRASPRDRGWVLTAPPSLPLGQPIGSRLCRGPCTEAGGPGLRDKPAVRGAPGRGFITKLCGMVWNRVGPFLPAPKLRSHRRLPPGRVWRVSAGVPAGIQPGAVGSRCLSSGRVHADAVPVPAQRLSLGLL